MFVVGGLKIVLAYQLIVFRKFQWPQFFISPVCHVLSHPAETRRFTIDLLTSRLCVHHVTRDPREATPLVTRHNTSAHTLCSHTPQITQSHTPQITQHLASHSFTQGLMWPYRESEWPQKVHIRDLFLRADFSSVWLIEW